jgi:hypothetical protein
MLHPYIKIVPLHKSNSVSTPFSGKTFVSRRAKLKLTEAPGFDFAQPSSPSEIEH